MVKSRSVLVETGAELTLMLLKGVPAHRAQCRSGDCRRDDPLHKKSWVTYRQAVTGTDCHEHSTHNDQWSSCTGWHIQIKSEQLIPISSHSLLWHTAWEIKMAAAVGKGEIRTKGNETQHKKNTQSGEGGDRWTETTLMLGVCLAPRTQWQSS